jgi:hypothetical protein
MKIEEMMTCKVTFPKAAIRAEKAWNLQHNTQLAEAIERCRRTRRTVYANRGNVLYVVKPRFPLVKSAMADVGNKSLLKVSVSVFTLAFSLGVRE